MPTFDNLILFCRTWEPDLKIQAVVCLVHGIGEHTGRYEHLAEALIKKGYVLTGFDLRGHGQSHGKRGYIPSYNALLNDISFFLDKTEKKFPHKKIFLYGHSLGGNLALNYGLRRKSYLAGIIATSPDLGLAFNPPFWKVFLAWIVNFIWPGFTQSTKLNINYLSHDKEVVKAYKNDPLVHDRISARLFINMQQSAHWALRHAKKFSLPLLLMHGSNDHITSPRNSRKFAEQIKKNSTFKLWQGFYHEIHNEPRQKEVFRLIITWLLAHTPQ